MTNTVPVEMESIPAAAEQRPLDVAIDRWTAEFSSRQIEHAFRGSIGVAEVGAFRRAMLICGPLYLVFIVSDYLQVGHQPAIWVILAARLTVCLLALGLGMRIGRDGARDARAVGAAYAGSRTFFIVALGLAFVIFPLSGRGYVELYPALIVMLMAGFFLIPARFVDRVATAVFAILGFNAEALVWMHPPMLDLPLALLLMLATLVFGAMASHAHALMRRQHYGDTMRQQQLNARLEDEVKSRQRLQQQAMILARTDSLTGIANRRHFMAASEEELKRASRYGGPLTAMILDIDHFKAINDTYGHAVGDLALTAVADTCKAVLRSPDLLGRIGGEEFAMLLPQTGIEGASVLAERLRQAIADIRLDRLAQPLNLTATIGVATWLGESDSLDDLLLRADRMLYRGKAQGRNRIVAARPAGKG